MERADINNTEMPKIILKLAIELELHNIFFINKKY
jgi:hypothetical protein